MKIAELSSGGSRPSDKGGGHPDPEKRGGGQAGAPGPSPRSATV